MNKRLIIFGIIAGVLLVLVVATLFIPKSGTQSPTIPIPFFRSSPTPTPTPQGLVVTAVLPNSQASQKYLPNQPVQFTFNHPVGLTGLLLEISPNVDVDVTTADDPNSLIVSPRTSWPTGLTVITVAAGTVSLSGEELIQPFSYSLNTGLPDILYDDTGI